MHMHMCMHVPTAAQPHLKGVRVISVFARACVLTAVVQCMLMKVHKQKTDTSEKERDKHACMHVHVCMHVPTAAQPHLKGARVCTTCVSVCAATISLIHPLCLSVCLYMYVRVSSCLYIQC
jgi:hypothetical protein